MGSRFKPRKCLYVDCESTGALPWHGDMPFAVSLADESGNTRWLEWPVDPFTRIVDYAANQDAVDYLGELLCRETLPKDIYNRKFDERMIADHIGIPMMGMVHDTYVKARVVNSLEYSYKLKWLCTRYAGIPADDEKTLQKSVVKARNVAKKRGWKIATKESHGDKCTNADYWIPKAIDPSNRDCELYGVTDVYPRLLVLSMFYDRKIAADPALQWAYRREMELYESLYRMEQRGVSIDKDINEEEYQAVRKIIPEEYDTLNRMLRQDLGIVTPLNPSSPKQLQEILFGEDGYGLTPLKATKTGYSTDFETLERYSEHPFVKQLLRYRGAEQADSLFFGKFRRLLLPDHIDKDGYSIHTTFNQLDTRTHRLSATTPNVQQISNPATSSKPFNITHARRPFKPRKGFVWYKFDVAQQEVRIFAELSNCKQMLSVLHAGGDINTNNTNMVWGGEGNPLGCQQMAYSLELGSKVPSRHDKTGVKQLADVWKEIGWDGRGDAKSKAALRIAEHYLARFGYDIVLAEKSFGKNGARTSGKNLIYAKFYGAGIEKMAKMMRTTEQIASMANAQLIKAFPEMKLIMREMTDRAKRDGYIITPYGRKLHVDRRKAYKALNYAIQGTAADMMKSAIIRIDRYYRQTGLDAHIILTVHDELDTEIWEGHCYKWLLRGTKLLMEDTEGVLKVPMVVEGSRIVKSWEDTEDLKWL